MPHKIGTIREFKTANFRVLIDALEEDDLDLSWDDDGSVREGLARGKYIAFVARARVFYRYRGNEVASDYLGNCIYESLEAFMDHKECGRYNKELAAKGEAGRCGSYFRDMIHEVCREARKEICTIRQVRIRCPQ